MARPRARACGCGCGEVLGPDVAPNRKYVNDTHRQRVYDRRKLAKARKAKKKAPKQPTKTLGLDIVAMEPEYYKDGRTKARRGGEYDKFRKTAWPEMILTGNVSQAEVARALDVDKSSVARWMVAYIEDKGLENAAENWSRDPSVEEALADFGAFCRRYWPDDQVTGFHMEWAGSMKQAAATGGRTMLLAPQRHGKSHLLRKYCVWRICVNPDVRILWVSQSMDLAKKAVGYVLDTLTTHEKLIADVLGPGQEFRPPPRMNRSWTAEEFTVGCRTKLQASPTMVALGKGGSILSRDADEIIVDDMQEHKHIRSPSMREKDEEWFFTDLMSRKLPKTSLSMIGSRQHVDDIYSKVLDKPDQWNIRIYQVHDPACTLPESDPDAHVDCMLWPEQYPYDYMQEQRAQQGEAYFQRNMMNDPSDDSLVYVRADHIDQHRHNDYAAGQPPSGKLVAGIDPASSKPVAGVLWCFRDGKRYLVDSILASPGTQGAREVMQAFYDNYGCRRFIVEKNGYQGEILRDGELQAMARGLMLHVKPHYTSSSLKWDEASGVVKMLHEVRNPEGCIVLPSHGDEEVLKRCEAVYRQWLTFDPDFVNSKHAQDDLVMASWFPQLQMDEWDKRERQRVEVSYAATSYAPSNYMAGVI